MKNNTKKIVYTAMFLAIAVLLPQVFHLIGGPAAGKLFLPMHLPVLLAGFLIGWQAGLITGLIAPFLSFLITGMPPVPTLFFMAVELPVYGLVAGLFKENKLNIVIKVLISMVAGRAALGLAYMVGAYVFNVEIAPWAAVGSAIVSGIPGIAIQIVLIPTIVFLLRKRQVALNA